MKFIVSSSYLLKKLQVFGGVINNNNTMPILDNFLFELSTNSLTISASDLETTVRGTLEVESDSQGSIAVSAKLLIDILKTFSEQPLTFLVKENNVIEISSTTGNYTLAYLDGEEFPRPVALPEASKVTLLGDVLATAVQKTIFAAGNDDLRPTMSGILFQFSENGLTFVGTDAHKLVKYERLDIKANDAADFIMPKKPLNILKGILAGSETEVTIEYNESNAKFSFDDMEFICRLIDGKYPNYDAVIPKENPNKLILNRSQFYSSINRLSLFSNKTTHQVRLKVADAENKDVAKRYEKYAEAQAWMIDNSLLMSAMSNGGTASVTKVTPFTRAYSLVGIKGDGNNYKYMRLQKEPVTKKQFDEAKAKWEEESKKAIEKSQKEFENHIK